MAYTQPIHKTEIVTDNMSLDEDADSGETATDNSETEPGRRNIMMIVLVSVVPVLLCVCMVIVVIKCCKDPKGIQEDGEEDTATMIVKSPRTNTQ